MAGVNAALLHKHRLQHLLSQNLGKVSNGVVDGDGPASARLFDQRSMSN